MTFRLGRQSGCAFSRHAGFLKGAIFGVGGGRAGATHFHEKAYPVKGRRGGPLGGHADDRCTRADHRTVRAVAGFRLAELPRAVALGSSRALRVNRDPRTLAMLPSAL